MSVGFITLYNHGTGQEERFEATPEGITAFIAKTQAITNAASGEISNERNIVIDWKVNITRIFYEEEYNAGLLSQITPETLNKSFAEGQAQIYINKDGGLQHGNDK